MRDGEYSSQYLELLTDEIREHQTRTIHEPDILRQEVRLEVLRLDKIIS